MPRAIAALGLLLALGLALGLLGCRSRASGSPDARSEDGRPAKLRVGTSGDYAPFSVWPHAAPAPRGFSVDVARTFAQQEGLELQWVRFRWPELLSELQAGSFDLALSGVTVRPDRSVAGRFALPLTVSGAIVLVPEVRSAPEPGSLAELDVPGTRLAVNAGGHLERVARQRFMHARIEAVPDNAMVLEHLRAGRVDGVVSDTLEAPHWQARLPGLKRIGPFTRDRKAPLLPAKSAALARRLDAWLLEAEADGRLARLRERHGLMSEPTARAGAALLASLDERLSLMPAVADTKLALGLSIEDRAREGQVLEAAARGVARAAEAEGRPKPDGRAVRRLFQAQIDAARWIQARRLTVSAAGCERAPTADEARRELEQALRPALLRIGERIARLIVAWRASGEEPLEYEAVARALAQHRLPDALLERIVAALHGLSPGSPNRDAATGASAPPPPAAGRDTAPSA